MVKLIEAVCTGNNGRSVIVDAHGNAYINRNNLSDQIRFISSGVEAAPEHDEQWDYEKASFVFAKTRLAGFISDEVDKNRYHSDSIYKVHTDTMAKGFLRVLRDLETRNRDAALGRTGLSYWGERTQTVPRDDVHLVLAMTERHKDRVEELYSGRDHVPTITTFNAYVGLNGDVKGCLGELSDRCHSELSRYVAGHMPTVVERFRGEVGV
jgi:protein-tyrosine-phosphatase